MIRDVRFALRALSRDRRFAAVVVLTLAIGVGVNTTVFTLLNSVALRPLPAPDASRVVRIFPLDRLGQRQNLFSYRDYLDYERSSPSVEALAAYIPVTVTLGVSAGTADPEPESLAYVVSANYFTILGMQPAAGRTFVRDDERTGAPRVAIVSDRLWKRRFAGDPQALGSTVAVNGRPFTVIGVAPERFLGTEPLVPEIWLPIAAHDVAAPGVDIHEDRDTAWLLMLGRLRDDVERARAEAELSVVTARLAAAYPSAKRHVAVTVVRGTFFSIEPRVWPIIALVMAVAALVLLIACANVANLTLARASSRQRELAIRLAIGATRARIVRLLAAESLVLGVAGGAAGLLVSGWALRFLYPIGVALVPFPSAAVLLDLSPDIRVFGYTFGLAALAGTAIGLAPAFQVPTPRISAGLHEDGAVSRTGFTPSRMRHALVVLQIAACLVLLAGAGLLTRAVQRARTLDLGFNANNVVMTSYEPRRLGYDALRAAEFNRILQVRASTIPSWHVSAFTSHVPLTGGLRMTSIETGASATAETRTAAPVRLVTSAYFDVLRIPIVAGRTFSPQELAGDASVAMLSEALARRFWPEGNPIGQTVRTSLRAAPATVVGVVRDTSSSTVWQGKEMAIYYPVQPATDARDLHLIIRFDGDAEAATAVLGRLAREIDPTLNFTAAPLAQAVRLWMLPSRVAAVSAGVLAVLALLLASIGIYSVLAYNVAHRTREIGIRMALGAASADVLRLIVRDGARLIAIGVAAGIAGALLTTRVLRGLLLDISALDPLTFATVTLLLCSIGLIACYLPARRAAAVDPWSAIR